MTQKFKIVLGFHDWQISAYVAEAAREMYEINIVRTAEEAYAAVHAFTPDLAILDYAMDGINPIEFHEGIEMMHPETMIVICVDEMNLEIAKRIWRRRSMDFIRKPIYHDRIVDDMNKIVRHIIDRRCIQELTEKVRELSRPIHVAGGAHSCDQDIYRKICETQKQEIDMLYEKVKALEAENKKLRNAD